MNSCRFMSEFPLQPVCRTLSLPRGGRQVLRIGLNCSKSRLFTPGLPAGQSLDAISSGLRLREIKQNDPSSSPARIAHGVGSTWLCLQLTRRKNTEPSKLNCKFLLTHLREPASWSNEWRPP